MRPLNTCLAPWVLILLAVYILCVEKDFKLTDISESFRLAPKKVKKLLKKTEGEIIAFTPKDRFASARKHLRKLRNAFMPIYVDEPVSSETTRDAAMVDVFEMAEYINSLQWG